MAFGTRLKKTFGKVKDFVVDKALLIAKKVAGFVGKAAQPILGAVGGVLGGPLGSGISRAGDVIGGFATKANGVLDKTDHRLRNNSILNGFCGILFVRFVVCFVFDQN